MFDGLSQITAPIVIALLLVQRFLNRNMPRVGGKMGPRTGSPELPVADGFARVDCREITVFVGPSEDTGHPTLKAYLRRGVLRRQSLVHVYRVAGCSTRIEVPAATPTYQRIDASETLALLRELPDPRLVRRLHLSDEPSFLDPWVRKVSGQKVFHLGNATSSGIVVLYRPDRRAIGQVGQTLLHEWLHLLAFRSRKQVRRFKRADRIERLTPLQFQPVWFSSRWTPVYEAWSELGEILLGYDDEAARRAALAAPVHAMIVWRQVEEVLYQAPARLRSTRLAEFEARAAFIHGEVAPKARAARAERSLWRRLLRLV